MNAKLSSALQGLKETCRASYILFEKEGKSLVRINKYKNLYRLSKPCISQGLSLNLGSLEKFIRNHVQVVLPPSKMQCFLR